VVFLARIAEQKRPLEAVRIVHPLMNEIPALHLAFVGEGPQEHAVREEAARLGVGDRVHLVGYQTDVADWLAAATVWLLPTERENFSIGVLEALASGCTVLSTICPGNDEVLVDGENALTFAVGDIAAATTSLRRLLSDEALRERLGTGASATAKQYSPEVMVARYHELYSRVPHAPDVLRNASPLEENALSSRESS
jgi:glycosyltransferase involved in cell wall biosynthesis